jgi:ZIP family zinc transporter
MSETMRLVLSAGVPAAGFAAGGTVAAYWPPTPRVRSYLQHFAAGVVFAALAVEVLPDVMHRKAPIAASVGFAVGVAAMLAIRALSRRLEAKGQGEAEATGGSSWGTVGVVGIDVLVDGALIGVMLAAERKAAGLLVTVALAIELLSLGLAVAATIIGSGASRARVIATTALLALLPPIGVAGGFFALGGVGGASMEAVLAFAAAALLYLVTEELLVEAHEVPETPPTTATFFAGFLLLMILDMIA